MNYFEWRDGGSDEAEKFKNRLKAGEKGNPWNPELAAEIAYSEGVREGRRQAGEALMRLINSN